MIVFRITEKLIWGSPVLESLTMVSNFYDNQIV